MPVLSAIVLLGALAGLFPTSQASSAVSSSGCLCTSDQPCWPSAGAFSQLESQLSQPLIYPVPTASPCYPPSDPSGNCTDVTTNWYDDSWRSKYPGSMMLFNWETYKLPNGPIEACFLNTSITGTCEQGRVPVVGVDARSVADIQAALGFAVEHSVKLVVKNTGHDFMGRSAARDSFMVWTHNMKDITYDAAFVPQGGPESETFEAITLGAGVQWSEAYAAANEHDRLLVGGGARAVGTSGGWLAGGGHSPLSTSYGLGVDNALEISIVLSTGEYLTTNKYQNPDLFWALRGGGGGTYGIVTSVTYRTYPMVPVQGWIYEGTVTNSSVLPELVEGLLRFQTQFADDGWGGYGQINGQINSQSVSFFYYAPNMTNETATRTTQGWQNFTQSLASYGVASTSTTVYSPSWYDVLLQLLYPNGPNRSGYVILAGRLPSRDTVASNNSQLAQLIINCNAELNLVAGGRVSQIDADSAGLNPEWRNAVAEVVCGTTWDEVTPVTEIQALIQQLKGWVKDMSDATPNDGAYYNEASPFEIDWQKTFFGEHYSALKSIKDEYDPYRLFVAHQGVGSEDWNEDLTCRYGS